MNKFHRHVIAASVAAAGLALAHTSTLAADSGLTRAEVREDLKDARATNTMTPSGEIGDTTEVLVARETLNALQTETMLAQRDQTRHRAAADRALDELVADLQALDAEEDVIIALLTADY